MPQIAHDAVSPSSHFSAVEQGKRKKSSPSSSSSSCFFSFSLICTNTTFSRKEKKSSPCINSALSDFLPSPHTHKVAQPLSLAIYKEKHTVLPVLPSFMSMSHDATPNTNNTTHHPQRRLVLSGGSKETSEGIFFLSRTTTTPFSRPFPGRGPLLPCLFPSRLESPTAFMSPGKNLDNAIPSRANH